MEIKLNEQQQEMIKQAKTAEEVKQLMHDFGYEVDVKPIEDSGELNVDQLDSVAGGCVSAMAVAAAGGIMFLGGWALQAYAESVRRRR